MKAIGSLSRFGTLAAVAATAALIAGCGSSNSTKTGSGREIGSSTFAQAADASASAAGEKVTYTMSSSGSAADSFSMTGTGEFNRSPFAGTMTMSVDAAGQTVDGMQVILSKNTMYMKYPSSMSAEMSTVTGGKPWMSLSIDGLGSSMGVSGLSSVLNGSLNNPTQELKILADSSTDGLTKVGTATINGVSSTEYSANLNLSKEAGAASGAERATIKSFLAQAQRELGGSSIPVKVWIDSDNLIRQMTINMTIKTAGVTLPMSMKMDILDYGKQSVPAAPPASETYDMTNLIKREASSGLLGG